MCPTRSRQEDPERLRRRRRARGRRGSHALAASSVLVGASMLATALGGTASASTGGGHPVTSFSLWESHNGGPVGAAMSALVSRFDRTHRTVQVSIDVTKASKKLLAAVAAGDPPVLAEISHYDGQYVKGNVLVPWNKFMKHSSVVTKKNFMPAVWANGTVGGEHYRLQADVKVSIVDYNKQLFQQAGISSPPKTWTELAADAAKLKTLGVIPIGWKDSSAHILPAFISMGGKLLKGSNTVGDRVDFNSSAGVRSFSMFRNLYSSGDLIVDHGTTLREDLAAGKIAMIDGTSAGYQKTLDAVGGKFPVGVFVEPGTSSHPPANLDQGLGFVLPKGHTKAQDEAAWTFVQWWFEPRQQAYWVEHTGFAPETQGGIGAIPQSFLSAHPGTVATIQAIKSPYTLPRPVSDSYKEVQAALDATFLDVIEGKQSVSAGLESLDQQGDAYLIGASKL